MPVAWDGVPVEWTYWQPETVQFVCPPKKPTACDRCGVVSRRRTECVGKVGHVIRFRAIRCRCNQITVYDSETDTCWLLDQSDFGPAGSWETGPGGQGILDGL
jgi:hypothetical protein